MPASPPLPRPFPLRQAIVLLVVGTALYLVLGALLLAATSSARLFRDALMEASSRLDDVRLAVEQMHFQSLLAAATGEQVFAVRHDEGLAEVTRSLSGLAALRQQARVPLDVARLSGIVREVAAVQGRALQSTARGDLPAAWAMLRSLGYEDALADLHRCLDECDAAMTARADATLARQDRFNGFALWCLGIFTPLFVVGGILFLRRAGRDAAANQAAQEALADSERRFRETFELAAVGIAHVALDGRFLRVNDRFAAIVGYSHAELTAADFATITHPDDLEADLDGQRRLLAGEIGTYAMEKRYLRKDGGIVWAHLTVSLARDAQGRPLHCISVIGDISDRKAAEARARESARTIGALLDATTDRVILADAAGTILAINKAGADSFGLSREAMIGRRFHELFGAPLAASRLVHLRRALATGRIQRFTDERDDVVLDHVVAPLPGSDGVAGRVALFARDATALVRAREEAEAASQAKSRFLANLGHEIRTPLNGILGMAQVMAGLDPDEEQSQCLDDIANASAALLGLIDDLLELSQIETGRVALEPGLFALADILEAASVTLSPRAAEKGLTLETALAADLPPLVLGDGGKLRRILLILVDNAIKFTGKGGVTVELRCREACPTEESQVPAVSVVCLVSDTGIGIAPEDLTRIFDSFTQADGSATRRFGGTGLGLAIARRLARLMTGDLVVESRPGQGSVFTLTAPFELPAPAPGVGPRP
ncbi:PAS domain S-box protein [Solidesulfovibrio sp.]|uniref:sensor histidine kinase n=1 Tax=Solidesulfovibrio sp. TaxID=2910990 RepID=UPI00262AE82C|nr:PAS domain S-box protein [Solidesulfovibrio sp.]